MYLHGLYDNSRQNHQHSGKNSIICAANLNCANDLHIYLHSPYLPFLHTFWHTIPKPFNILNVFIFFNVSIVPRCPQLAIGYIKENWLY